MAAIEPEAKTRCAWPVGDPLMLRYHDEEWGVPVHDDRLWFEHIILDAFQAGLSWRTILHKREGFRAVFHNFEPERVARMTARECERARQNPEAMRAIVSSWLEQEHDKDEDQPSKAAA